MRDLQVTRYELDVLRADPRAPGYSVLNIRKDLADHGLTPADIDTSAEELDQLWLSKQRYLAQCSLDHLRRQPNILGHSIDGLLLHLRQTGLSLDDIGTSQEELDELKLERHRQLALRELIHLQSNPLSLGRSAIMVHSILRQVGLSPEDIGSSQEELNELYQIRRMSLLRN